MSVNRLAATHVPPAGTTATATPSALSSLQSSSKHRNRPRPGSWSVHHTWLLLILVAAGTGVWLLHTLTARTPTTPQQQQGGGDPQQSSSKHRIPTTTSISTSTTSSPMQPTLYLPHGGGPLPLLGDAGHRGLTKFLGGLARRVAHKPKAILLVSAHWEESEPQLTSSPAPDLLFDYFGFPPATYELRYPAPGSPVLAQQAAELLRAAGFKPSLNPKRGLDHGAFIPLMLVYPDADIPVVQLSLKRSLDPEEHYQMGAALAPLRSQDVLVMASGMSFHNMNKFRDGGTSTADGVVGQDFQQWLLQACHAEPGQRRQLLNAWASAPGARNAHPREEHLLPLMVAAGAAQPSGSGTGSDEADARGVALWDGECMGAAVAGIGFGQFAA